MTGRRFTGTVDVDRPALQAELHGDLAAMATQPDVVRASTFDEMIRCSRIPARFWYAPKVEVKVIPTVDPDVSRSVGERLGALKTRHSWTNAQLADALAVGQGVLWRFTHQKIHHDEVDGVLATLDRLEATS